MFRNHHAFVVYRYELILALIILLLTGSIGITSRDADTLPPPHPRYPYRIALTFDDGPHPFYTDRILTVLRTQEARASFFFVGSQLMRYPALAQVVALAGHEVLVHGFTHHNLTHLSDHDVRTELAVTARCIETLTGQKPAYFRPPGGQYDLRVQRLARELPLEMILWSALPKDHEEQDPEMIVRKVMEQAFDGGVILLHSGRMPTVVALPRIIAGLRWRGYQCVTVSELRRAFPAAGRTVAAAPNAAHQEKRNAYATAGN
jgi:peptidoglycan/xylan/chitin deacetylase (PgdA/CDA1 family)